jgi:hypothetical protein
VAAAYAQGGGRSLQGLLERLDTVALPLAPDEAASLDDWDTEEDRAKSWGLGPDRWRAARVRGTSEG